MALGGGDINEDNFDGGGLRVGNSIKNDAYNKRGVP